jgi:hypothetical protein
MYAACGDGVCVSDLASGEAVTTWSVGRPWVLDASTETLVTQLFAPEPQGSSLLGVDPHTGSERWREATPGGQVMWVVADAGVAVVATIDGTLRAFDVATGSPRWSRVPPQSEFNSWRPPVIANGSIFLGRTSDLEVRSLTTGALQWTARTSFSIYGATVAAGRLLVHGSTDGYEQPNFASFLASGCGQSVCFPAWTRTFGARVAEPPSTDGTTGFVVANTQHPDGSTSWYGTLYAFDLATGATQWSSSGSGGPSAPVIAGDVVWTAGWDGELEAHRRAGCGASSCAPARTIQIEDGEIGWQPMVVGDEVVVPTGSGVYAFAAGQMTLRPPAPPPDLHLSDDDRGHGYLTLRYPADTGGSPLNGMRVVRSDGLTTEYDSAHDAFGVAGEPYHHDYSFRVQMRNASGWGDLSAPSNVVNLLPALTPATNVQGVPGDGSLRVTWDPSPDLYGRVASYRVYTNGSGPIEVAPDAPRVVDLAGLTSGVAYSVTVGMTVDNVYLEAEAGPFTPTRSSDSTPPDTTITTRPDATTTSTMATFEFAATEAGSTFGCSLDEGAFAACVSPMSYSAVAAGEHHFAVRATDRASNVDPTPAALSWTVTVPPPPAEAPPAPPPPAPPAPAAPQRPSPASSTGYWMLDRTGTVHGFGTASDLGPGPVDAVDIEPTPSGAGYWIVDSTGAVTVRGDAPALGDHPSLGAGERVTSISATPDGLGYWLFTTHGRALPYGTAPSLGDMSGTRLNAIVVDSVATPTGHGYYLVAADGGIFTFGDAVFHGSMGGVRLNAPVQSLVPDPDGTGYWLVASDGGIFTFEAPFLGSMGATPLNRPVTGMVGDPNGYLMVAEDGGIFSFGDVTFYGSLGDRPPPSPVVAVALATGPGGLR